MRSFRDVLSNPAWRLLPIHISLAFVGLMWLYSFLNYNHAYPITTFYQEWGTALLGLLAMLPLLGAGYWKQAEVPRIVLLPVGLMLLVVLQYVLGWLPYLEQWQKVGYFGQMLLYALYLMWAAMLIMLGAHLREVLGLRKLALTLAVFLLLGAELNAFAGLHQHYHWHTFLEYRITLKVASAVYGNIAQPNHFADYMTLGLASLGLLYAAGRLKAWQAALLGLPILYVLPLSGSRGPWFYLPWLTVMAFLWQWRERSQRPLLYFCMLALLGYGAMHWVVQLPWLSTDTGTITSVQRSMADDVGTGSIRLYLWKEAALIFAGNPLLGAGFGGYAWQHYMMLPVLQNHHIAGLYNNAHNLVMQLAAEGGLAGLLIFFGTVIPWLLRARQDERSIYHWWGFVLLGVLGIHSMEEYPLWYAYFLGIAAFLLGMLDTGRYRLGMGMAGRAFISVALLLGVVALYQLYQGYGTYEKLNRMRHQVEKGSSYYSQLNDGIQKMQGIPLFQPYADLIISPMLGLDAESLQENLKLNTAVEHFIPTQYLAYRQSFLLAASGDLAGAQTEIERAIWSYPGDFNGWAEATLRGLAAKDPEHYAGLLKFAIQKHEEYLGAVHSK